MNKEIIVLLPVYHSQEDLDKTLLSLQADFDILDVVVVDDGSEPPLHTPASAAIHVMRLKKNMGIEHALNAGLNYIYSKNYKYIARIDAGDIAIHNRFKKQYDFLEAHPDHGAVGSYANVVTVEGQFLWVYKTPLSADDVKRVFPLYNPLIHPSIMLRVATAKQNGFYSDQYKAAEDYDFFYRLSKITKIANLGEPLIVYEVGNTNSISASKRYMQFRSVLNIQLHHFNALNPLCYLGLMRILFFFIICSNAFAVPRKWAKRLKIFLSKR